mmetsp:Transcript_14057/g.21905  ORF Transcript_14057/g.21905 Transcript_14057/m.21905 type:complete len:92 (+) Transcript_14057:746-1021(+)
MLREVQHAASYLQIMGMIEAKNGSTYSVYNNSVNSDIFTWKEYNSSELYVNNHSLLEMKFDLEDGRIQGTENHLNSMEIVVSRYQVRYNFD